MAPFPLSRNAGPAGVPAVMQDSAPRKFLGAANARPVMPSPGASPMVAHAAHAAATAPTHAAAAATPHARTVAPSPADAVAASVASLTHSHRWKVLGVGVAANASFAAALSGIPATAVQMRGDYALANADLGFVLGMIGLGIALSELPWGLLTDRWGDRRVLLVGLAATALALLAMAMWGAPHAAHVPSMPLLAAGLLAVGLLGGSVNGSSGRAVMRWFRDNERGLAMSVRQCAVPLGGGIGALILPALVVHMGFVAAYLLLAAGCLAAMAMAWRWLWEPPHAAEDSAPHASRQAAGTHYSPLCDVRLLGTVIAMTLLAAPQIAVITFGTVFLHDVAHVGLVTISVALGVVQGGAAVTRVWSGRYTDRRRNRPQYLRVCTVVVGVVFAALALLVAFGARDGAPSAQVTPWLVAMLVVGGVVASAWHGIAFTELATMAGADRAGTALGLGNTGVFLTMFATPVLIPPLLALGGWTLVWVAALMCAALAWPLFVWAQRAR